jgi:hypothetical protein
VDKLTVLHLLENQRRSTVKKSFAVLLIVAALVLAIATPALAGWAVNVTGYYTVVSQTGTQAVIRVTGVMTGQITQYLTPGRSDKALFSGCIGTLVPKCGSMEMSVVNYGKVGAGSWNVGRAAGALVGAQGNGVFGPPTSVTGPYSGKIHW